MAVNDDVHLHMLSSSNDRGVGTDGVTPDDDDENEDADGQAVDPLKQKPKLRNIFFADGVRRIDYILAWNVKSKKQEECKQARHIFEENLKKEGLEIEPDVRGAETHFLKIHAPIKLLCRYADLLKIRVPMKQSLALQHIKDKYEDWERTIEQVNPVKGLTTRVWNSAIGCFRNFLTPFQLDENVLPKIKRQYTAPYSVDKEYLFEIPENKETMFSNAQRSRIVDFILKRKAFTKEEQKAYSFGFKKMLADGYYSGAFPLHEGHWKPGSADNPRKLLFDYWANWRNILKFQPHDHIRQYFGEKIGLYFSWLGFYTTMLVPASVVGLLVFIYGCIIMYTNTATSELCASDNITMCPLCDVQCPYWKLSQACTHSAASRIFDNGATVFFAIFMSLWGTLFLEFWKRREATIQHKWDLTNFVHEEEPPRPEYLGTLKNYETMKINPITGMKEPYLPFWRRRFPVFLLSYSLMFFLAALAIGAVIGVIAYRVSMLAALQMLPRQIVVNSTVGTTTVNLIYQNASLVTTVTAALINLAFIIFLNFIYGYLAFWLTDWECLRTQSEYDNSITLKLFALQFCNYFSSIVYIAFFKGRFVGRPGKYRTIFGARQEECEAGGCLIELCIQLAIIMIGKQLIQNNFIEIVLPKIIKFVKRKCSKETKAQKLARTPWEKDMKLQPAQNTSLFYEYLEMVLQFGFLTIFCAAFPLAPIFSLLNNIIEIRTDALKFITHLRRPMADRAATIGIWYSVLYGISRIAILSNALVIALTSDFIPRLVYQLRYSNDSSLTGYVEFTLSHFNTSDFKEGHGPSDSLKGDVELCRYRDFRNPPWHYDREYRRSEVFWHILAAQLAFVLVFENVIVVITGIIAWLIPDMPQLVREQVRREAYVTNEIILNTELTRAHASIQDIAEGKEDRDDVAGRYSPRLSEDDIQVDVTHRKPDSKSEPRTYV